MSVITATVQQRRDTAANWTSNNPTLLAGEVGFETDTRRSKLGDGATAWNSLAYISGTAAQQNTSAFDPAGSAAAAQAASQPVDATLTALAGLDATAGLVEQTAADTFTKRAIGTGASTSIPTRGDADSRYIQQSLGTTKGDIVGFSASGTPVRVGAGTNGQMLQADSSTSSGLVYAWNSHSVWMAPPLSTTAGTSYAWTDQPSALTFFLGQGRWVLPANLSGATQARISILNSSAGSYVANSKLRLLYRLGTSGYSATITDYSQLGASAQVEVAFAVGIAFYQSAWIDIASGAKADVLIALAGIDGNGTADPQFLSVAFEYR